VSLTNPRGLYAYTPDRWGILHVNLVNPRNEPVDLLTTTHFSDQPTQQYGRRVHLPARSKMQTWHPILLPAVPADGKRDFEIHTLLMDVGQDREILIRSDTGRLQLDGVLRAAEGPVSGIFEPPESADAPVDLATPSVLLAMIRDHLHYGRQVTRLPARVDSSGEESLDALDQLLVADDRLLSDGAGLTAVRRWLYGGGRLWVMLDRVDPRVLRELLGDEAECSVIDRVSLTSLEIRSASHVRAKGAWAAEFEEPVDLVRITAPSADVHYTVNGWPAAFWKECGEGRLLVTTLGSRGWMRLKTEEEIRNRNKLPGALPAAAPGQLDPALYIPQEPMTVMAMELFAPRRPPLVPASKLEPLVEEYIGYSIPPRSLVVGLLIGFTGMLGAAGVWLSRTDRLEWMGAAGPALALLVGVGLVLVGRVQRAAVPPAVANLQRVEVIPGTADLRIQGLAGLFSPDSGAASISATRGGRLMPDMTGLEGTTRRLVWSDLDDWHWENLPATAGLRTATFSGFQSTAKRIEARATFGPKGLEGRLEAGEGRQPSDALIATRDGRIGVEFSGAGKFTASADNVFSDGQYLSAVLLSDEQNRRRRVLEDLFNNPKRGEFPVSPQLLFWTAPWETGFRFGEGQRELGAALVSAPLVLERPPVGTVMRMPHPFLPYRETVGPDGATPSTLYDPLRREWSEKSSPSMTWLQFRVPPVLLPVEVEGARVSVRVSGPMGRLELAGWNGTGPVPIHTWTDPVGTLTLDVTRPELLPLSKEGGILLRVSAGDPDRPELTNPTGAAGGKRSSWRIESLSLEIEAKAVAPPG
jgi:hypothetical protein